MQMAVVVPLSASVLTTPLPRLCLSLLVVVVQKVLTATKTSAALARFQK
jgi:hypothetical protein